MPLHRYTPALGTAAVAVLWGTSGVLVRESALSAAAIAFGRAAVGAAALGVWELALPKRPRRGGVHNYGRSAVRSLFWSGALLAVHWLTFVMALQRAPIGTVLLGIYLAPLAVAALARRTLQERVTPIQVMSLALALGGSAFVLQPGQTGGGDGLALIAVSALAYAGSMLASKKALDTVPPARVAAGQLATVTVLLAPLLALDPPAPTRADVLVISILGLVYSALALLAYLAFLRRLSATASGILLYLEPVSALIAGWVFLGERPASLTWLGASLVLLSGVLVTREAAVKDAPSQAS
ncbi:DMT family transporter [Streptomyces mirabilis]|uniref:DMT family transporter n=1 Tax=Streptomyces mirabilis TaxID=68239 RepID=UPI003790C1E1